MIILASTVEGPRATHPKRPYRLARFLRGRTLADCATSGRDNITLLRLTAAILVLLGHCSLAGFGRWMHDPIQAVLPQTSSQVAGLMLFFVTSGFLITLSYQRTPQLLRYLRARILRIWPAFMVCAVGCAFVLGPALTSLSAHDYFAFSRPDSPYRFVLNDASLFRLPNVLPGLFLNNLVARQVNTPNWSIPVEFSLYLWIAAAGLLGMLRFPAATSIFIATVFSFAILWPMASGHFDYANLELIVKGFFGAGAIACLLRRHIPVSTGLMIVLALICAVTSHTRHAVPFIWLTATYFVFWFAYVPRLPTIPGNADLSYGTYLWGWPVQQSVIAFFGVHEPLVLFAIATPIVLLLATLSWFFVEKPALRLKNFQWRRVSATPLIETAH